MSWNPIINKFRKQHHFLVHPENYFAKNYLECSALNYFQKTQLLLSLSPHHIKNECKLLFERHQQEKSDVLYEIRVKLYGFYDYRMRIETDCLKTFSIREDEHSDIFIDTLIFEECLDYDNYIIIIEAVPLAFLQHLDPTFGYSNKKDPLLNSETRDYFIQGKLKLRDEILFSLNFYAWFDFDLVQIPFKLLTHQIDFKNLSLFQLSIDEDSEIEISVEGNKNQIINIQILDILKFNKLKILDSDFISKSQSPIPKANILTCKLVKGIYFIRIHKEQSKELTGPHNDELDLIKKFYYNNPNENNKELKITLKAFGNKPFNDFESSQFEIENIEPITTKINSEYSYSERFLKKKIMKIETIINNPSLNINKSQIINVHPENVSGSKKYSVKSLQSVHRNPGIHFFINKKITCVQFKVKLISVKGLFKFCLFSIKDNFDVDLKYESEVINQQYTSSPFYLSPNLNGFLALVIFKESVQICQIHTEVLSNISLQRITNNNNKFCQYKYFNSFTNKILPVQGCRLTSSSFFLNSYYVIELTPDKSSNHHKLFLEMITKDKQMHIGLYIIRLDQQEETNLLKLSPDQMNDALKNKIFLPLYNTYYSELQTGKYLIVPTTFDSIEKSTVLDYSLNIYSESKFMVEMKEGFIPKQKIAVKIDNVSKTSYLLKNLKNKSSFFIWIHTPIEENHHLSFLIGGFIISSVIVS